MTIPDYLLPLWYKPIWYILDKLGLVRHVIFYCEDPLDYAMFLPVRKHFEFEIIIVAKNRKTSAYLKARGVQYKRYPFFPRAVIMTRHTAYKFPIAKIKKFGFDHGLYQFKRWTDPKYYNQFDIYFVSSESQVKNARLHGVTTARAIGYPKLDQVFNGEYTPDDLRELVKKTGLDPQKRTVIFTSTWDVGGLSALQCWIDRVQELTEKYNILLTVHTWTKEQHIRKLKSIPEAIYLEDFDITKYLLIADVFVGDYNSLIGEFCALDKPIVTFKVPDSDRAVPDVKKMIADISYQVESFDEIPSALEYCINHPREKSAARHKANEIFYMALDGMAGKRAADNIKELLN